MAGTTDGPAVGQAILEISRPPGEKVFSFADGVELLRQGTDIDYDGASGPIDFDDTGDQIPVMGLWRIVDGEYEFQGTSD
jgi:branched-chain amino acid transport system substrate-binding protein